MVLKRRGWKCPDPEGSLSVDGSRFCTKHDQWDDYCKRGFMLNGGTFDGEPCDYTHIGPGGLAGSPDGVCVYPAEVRDAEDGSCYVELLIDGKKVRHIVPPEAKDEYWESCIFCGEPEVRK